ncbi:Nitroreductase [Burkholderiales bacterium]|jgi:nitroreductase|nr:Nitroreductase [Burkholderiales bacterium]
MSVVSDLPFPMPLAAALGGRHSVRNFKPNMLNRQQILSLLFAAVRAPAAIDQEPWAFVVVQDKALLKRISDRAKPLFLDEAQRQHVERTGHGANILADPDFNIFYNAGTLILLCGLAVAPYVAADCWLAAENVLLAAHAAGLGACVIGSAVAALNQEEVKRELDIPPSYTVVVPIIAGVPVSAGEPSPRREPRILHWK